MGARGARRTYSEEQRSEALRLYEQHGPAEASRRTGIQRATISKWAGKAGVSSKRAERVRAASEAAQLSRERRSAQLADAAGEAAQEFLDRAREGNPSNGRNDMISFGVAVDKMLLLSGEATERVEVTEDQRKAIVRGIRDELAGRREAKRARSR